MTAFCYNPIWAEGTTICVLIVLQFRVLWQRLDVVAEKKKCVYKAWKANLLLSFWHSISAQKNTSSTSSSSSVFLSTIISGRVDCHVLPPPRVRCNLVWAYFMQIQFLFQKKGEQACLMPPHKPGNAHAKKKKKWWLKKRKVLYTVWMKMSHYYTPAHTTEM